MKDDDMFFSMAVYKDGKATIPLWVRKQLKLKEGDVLQVKVSSVHINRTK